MSARGSLLRMSSAAIFVGALLTTQGIPAIAEATGRSNAVRVEVIKAIRHQHQIQIVIRVINELPVTTVVPYCDGNRGRHEACVLSTAIQVRGQSGWHDAPLACNCSILGGPKLETVVVLNPRDSVDLTFSFAWNLFALPKSRIARVAVEAWPDEGAMRNHTVSEYWFSESFQVP